MSRARIITSLIAVVTIACILTGAFAYRLLGFDRTLPTDKVEVIVPKGATLHEVATLLDERGVIRSGFAFRAYATARHLDSGIRYGAYSFGPRETSPEILDQLLSGGSQIAVWITIPEGYTAEQIALEVQNGGIDKYPALVRALKPHEGFLFPDTYLVPLAATPDDVRKLLTDQFAKELPADAAQRARALHVTVAQAVTIASLVEREAKIEADRPMIAGVIYNRLHQGMPLQVDATIEYALPAHKSELTLRDLRVDSPYNTYLHAGLPPTPIANPGLPSLEAALHPAKTDALYYVYCGNGHHVFAKTLAEHQANVERCLH